MPQRYNSFLLRCWHLEGDEQRIKIEHMQSGQGTQVRTLAAALAWIDLCWSAAGADAPVAHPDPVPVAEDRGPVDD
jgi:hypothetical protein